MGPWDRGTVSPLWMCDDGWRVADFWKDSRARGDETRLSKARSQDSGKQGHLRCPSVRLVGMWACELD